jgi:hypothetical protein
MEDKMIERELFKSLANILIVGSLICIPLWFAIRKAKAERLKHPYIVLISDSTGSHFIDENEKTDSLGR